MTSTKPFTRSVKIGLANGIAYPLGLTKVPDCSEKYSKLMATFVFIYIQISLSERYL